MAAREVQPGDQAKRHPGDRVLAILQGHQQARIEGRDEKPAPFLVLAKGFGDERGGAPVRGIGRILDDRLRVDVDRDARRQSGHHILEPQDPVGRELLGSAGHEEVAVRCNRIVPYDELVVATSLYIELDPGKPVRYGGEVRVDGVFPVTAGFTGAESAMADDRGFRVEDHGFPRARPVLLHVRGLHRFRFGEGIGSVACPGLLRTLR